MARKRRQVSKYRASTLSTKVLIRRFEDAVSNLAFLGAKDPADRTEIRREYAFYRAELKRRLDLASLVSVELRKE